MDSVGREEDEVEVQKLQCVSCGAPIEVPPDLDAFYCQYCGMRMTVRRGEGYVALQAAEKVAQAIEANGSRTQSVIQEELAATRAQLQRLELNQELTAAQSHLYRVQSDLRSLERQRRLTGRERRQRRELRHEEERLLQRMQAIERALAPEPEPADADPTPAATRWSPLTWQVGCLIAVLMLAALSCTLFLLIIATFPGETFLAFALITVGALLIWRPHLHRGRRRGRFARRDAQAQSR